MREFDYARGSEPRPWQEHCSRSSYITHIFLGVLFPAFLPCLSSPFSSDDESPGLLEAGVETLALARSGREDMSLSGEVFNFFAFLSFFPLAFAESSRSLVDCSSEEFYETNNKQTHTHTHTHTQHTHTHTHTHSLSLSHIQDRLAEFTRTATMWRVWNYVTFNVCTNDISLVLIDATHRSSCCPNGVSELLYVHHSYSL